MSYRKSLKVFYFGFITKNELVIAVIVLLLSVVKAVGDSMLLSQFFDYFYIVVCYR